MKYQLTFINSKINLHLSDFDFPLPINPLNLKNRGYFIRVNIDPIYTIYCTKPLISSKNLKNIPFNILKNKWLS